MAKSRARKFAELLDSSDNVKSSRLTNAQSNLSTLGTITTVDGTNDKVVVRDDTNGEMKLATITNAALQGPQGIQGIQGIQGPAGADGATGPAGAAGTGNAPSLTQRHGNTGSNGWATRTHNLISFAANKKYLVKCIGPFTGRNNYNNTYGGAVWLNQTVSSTGGTYGKCQISGSHTLHFNNNGVFMITAGSSGCTLQFATYAYYHQNQAFYTYGSQYSDLWAIQLN